MNSGQFPHRMREDFNQQKSGSYKIMLRIWRTEHLKLKSERFETSIIHNEERGLGDIDTVDILESSGKRLVTYLTSFTWIAYQGLGCIEREQYCY